MTVQKSLKVEEASYSAFGNWNSGINLSFLYVDTFL